MKRIILHIDFDSFFASVEQQDNPRFRGKPIGITATNGRNCIIAASREAKARGIRSPGRTYEAKRICPAIQFAPAHFVRYWEISKKFLAICKDYSPVVEIFSIDEVFIDVTQTAHLFGGVYPLVTKIKDRLRREIGEYVTASFGISYNKLLAKLASGLKKPNGLMEIRPEDVIAVYNSSRLTDVCGIGERIKTRLNQIGIRTLIQLRLVPLSALIAEFGEVEGKFLKSVGMAIDNRPVIPYTMAPEVKSVGRNYCLPQNEYDQRKVLQNLYELCEEVALKLRRLKKKARTVGLYLRGNQSVHGRRTFGYYFDSGKELFEACLHSVLESRIRLSSRAQAEGNYELRFESVSKHSLILDSSFMIPAYVRQIGIWAGNLIDAQLVPSMLFREERKKDKLQKIIDSINEEFGDHTIRNAFLLYADKLTTVPNGYLADKYERMKLANS